MRKFKVAVVVGSNRRESINRKLAQAIAKLAENRVDAKLVQIGDLPMYNQDLEEPSAGGCGAFQELEIEQADALLFVTPEHNRSLPAVLKNAINWGSPALWAQFMGRKARCHYGNLSRRHCYRDRRSDICVKFWATWGLSSWVARPI